MPHILRELVPSMFQRRLLLLLLTGLGVAALLATQLARLTVLQGSERRTQAELALIEEDYIPTIRGRILDRRGRILAQDVPANDVAVMYYVISGQWAYECAHDEAKAANKRRWGTLDITEREQLIAACQPRYAAQVESLWKTLCEVGHIDRPELEERQATAISRVSQIASFVQMHDHPPGLADLDDPAPLRKAAQEVKEQRQAQAMLTDVDDAALVKVRTMIAAADGDLRNVWTQVSIKKSHKREYPLETLDVVLDRHGLPSPIRDDDPMPMRVEGVGMHVVGLMRPAYQDDIRDRPFVRGGGGSSREVDMGGYRPGDKVGASGIEKAQERELRGKLGEEVSHLDTGQETFESPVAGRDITLTIDAALEGRIQALMDPAFGLMKVQEWQAKDPENAPEDQPHRPVLGDLLNGGAVVLDLATGQVLAAVSTPALSLRQLRDDSIHRTRDDPEAMWNDKVNDPFVNRAISRAFQPGSTVKPLVLAAAVTDRKIGYDETVTCNGFMDPGHPDRFRCWYFKLMHVGHGPLTGPQAIEHSCNIFFYTMGSHLGAQRLTWWYRQFGLGDPLGCGLDDEIGGSVPDLARAEDPPRTGQDDPFSESSARLLGIGQGPIAWTPLQAANVYATLARNGIVVTPTFVLSPDPAHPRSGRLGLDPHGVSEALEGMDLVVNDPDGTANHLAVHLPGREHIFNCPGVHVRGKSGTADAAELKVNGKVVRQGAHAWFIGLVNKEGEPRPRYAIAVVVEYGGSGGNVAGPVANQILYALRDEGYL